MRWNVGSLALLATLALPAMTGCLTAGAPGGFDRARLFGIVFDDQRRPLAWVEVRHGGGRSVMTDISGRFVLDEVPRGPVTITASRPGYGRVVTEVTFTNRTQVLYIRMHSAAFHLELAEAALGAGDTAEAAPHVSRALETAPDDDEVRYLAAVVAL